MLKKNFEKPCHQILVLAIKEGLTAYEKEKIRKLYAQVYDRELFKACVENEVEAIVASRLFSAGIENLPAHWHDCYIQQKVRLTEVFEELKSLAWALKKNGIEIIVLKNGGICLGIIKDPGLCPMGDIDTLIRKSQFLRAHEIILEEGFVFKFRSKNETEDLQIAFEHGSSEYCKKLKSGLEMWFELSWRTVAGRWIQRDMEPDTEGFFARSVLLKDEKIRMLAPEDNLLQVALHTAKHSYVRAPGFRLHLDVERIVRHQAVDWKVFVAKVKALHVNTAVYFSLYIPRMIFQTPIPDDVLEQLRPGLIKRKVILLWLDRIGLMYPKQRKFSGIGYVVFTSLLFDGITDLISGVFPKTDKKETFLSMGFWAFSKAIKERIYFLLGKKNV